MRRTLSLILALAAVSCGDDDSSPNGPSSTGPTVSFFVTSVTSPTGNLGGLAGADARCQRLAAAAGHGAAHLERVSERRARRRQRQPADRRAGSDRHWSLVQREPGARRQQRDRAARASGRCRSLRRRTRTAHQRAMDRLAICRSSTTSSPARIPTGRCRGADVQGLDVGVDDVAAQVGHSDGFGPNQSTAGTLSSWNSAHASQNCADTAPRGGAGRFYCFAR